jgi:AcrR family transcriptional regulator
VATERRGRLSADDWAQAALTALTEGGLVAVAVEPLAARLGATKGSFYWHFGSRDDLIRAALERWERQNTDRMIALLEQRGDPRSRLADLLTRVMGSAGQSMLEAQILAAADHPLVNDAVRRVIDRRVGYLVSALEEAGLDPGQATARAILLYTAYAGHDQLAARVPGALPVGRAGGPETYRDLLLDVVLPG